ncbi:MAG TPA: hypothetical protein VKA34_14170, partial [Balneolales bacterium]|nr:hypothetical protein [Balneolales bacterium]
TNIVISLLLIFAFQSLFSWMSFSKVPRLSRISSMVEVSILILVDEFFKASGERVLPKPKTCFNPYSRG